MSCSFREITTDELIRKLGNPGVKIIDTRPVDAYNGWTLQNESRGGHIKGAKSLSVKWLKYMDWIEMVRYKNIDPHDELILYGYSRQEVEAVSVRFRESGFGRIRAYDHFVDEWAAGGTLPMEKLARFRHLVPATWVRELSQGGNPAHYENDRYLIVHAHYRNRDAYSSGHIPGAVDMDTLALETPETWNRRSPEELKRSLEQHGITADTTVVLYGKYMDPDTRDPFPGSAAGDIGAMRCAFIMIYAGVRDVRVLNGGFQSWLDEGFGISRTEVPKKPAGEFGSRIPVHPELAVDTPEAKEILKADDAVLVCVRSRAEYTGEVSGYNYIEAKGRIPGAVFADCGSDAYHMENYRNFDHTTREFQEIGEIWKQSGITRDKRLAFYCGTGWRGSEAWFNAWLMGWPRVSLYDGGWFEWSADPENPFETGVPEHLLKQWTLTE